MTNPLTINPHEELKRKHFEDTLGKTVESSANLIEDLIDAIDDLSDVKSSQHKTLEYPDTENMNEKLDMLQDDMQASKDSISDIPDIVTREYNATTTMLDLVQTEINEIQPMLASLESATKKRGYSNIIFISDNFTSNERYDPDFPVNASNAFVDNTLGAVTLNRRIGERIVPANFKVLKSNRENLRDVNDETPVNFFYEGIYYGYADNVIPEGQGFNLKLKTNPPKLVMEQATEAEKLANRFKVFDGAIDTAWVCEYVENSTSNDTQPLLVDILLDLGGAQTISNVSLTPYLIHQGDVVDVIGIKGGTNAGELSNIQIHRNLLTPDRLETIDQPDATSAPTNSNYNSVIDIAFDPVEMRYLLISLSQAHSSIVPYPKLKMTVGRENPDTGRFENRYVNLDYLQSMALSSREDINIPTAQLIRAVTGIGGQWSVKPSNFASTVQEDRMHQAIGISELVVNRVVYDEISEFISAPFLVEGKVEEVRLRVDEIIPSVFGNDSWIDYELSFDGNTFYPIAAYGAGRDVNDKPLVLTPKEEVSQIRFKAIFKRPIDRDNITPVLRGYQLEVKTA